MEIAAPSSETILDKLTKKNISSTTEYSSTAHADVYVRNTPMISRNHFVSAKPG